MGNEPSCYRWVTPEDWNDHIKTLIEGDVLGMVFKCNDKYKKIIISENPHDMFNKMYDVSYDDYSNFGDRRLEITRYRYTGDIGEIVEFLTAYDPKLGRRHLFDLLRVKYNLRQYVREYYRT